MIRRIKHLLYLIPAITVLISVATCQQPGRQFDWVLPEVGQRLPDITILDADGNDFHLRSVNENYTVLVFGCLT